MTTPGKELLFLALGGSGEIGMNANLYGCDGKWIMADLGVTFGSHDYPGIDIVMPDLEFIEDRKKDLLGIILTHGHEDHIGAIPYLAAELGVPLYANRFTAGLIAHKLAEEGLEKDIDLKVVDIDDSFQLGPFGIRLIPLAHSILEMSAVVIDTPYGRVFHTGDWKLDEEPILGVPATAAALTAVGDEGIDVLVCDSTNAFNPEASGSEGGLRAGLEQAVGAAKGRVVVTTFASNAARLATLGAVAKATGRTLCVAGRSLDRILGVARSVGYLKDFPPTVDFDEAMRLPRDKVMVIATGGQGEPRAALARMAADIHQICSPSPRNRRISTSAAIRDSPNSPRSTAGCDPSSSCRCMARSAICTNRRASRSNAACRMRWCRKMATWCSLRRGRRRSSSGFAQGG